MDQKSSREGNSPSGRPDEERKECDWARRQLSAFIDSELQHAELERLEAHLLQCHGCRQAEWELRKDWKDLGELPAPDLDGGSEFLSRVHQQLEIQRRRLWLRFGTGAAVAAAILLICLLGLQLSSKTSSEIAIIEDLPVLEELSLIVENGGDLHDFVDAILAPTEETSASPDEWQTPLDLLLEEELEGESG